MQMFQKLETIK